MGVCIMVPWDQSIDGPLTPYRAAPYHTVMKQPAPKETRKQIGVRISQDLTLETKVLALKTGQGFNDLVEEALKDLLKKYKAKG